MDAKQYAACLWLLWATSTLHAQETVFYKCTDTQGKVSMQNGIPCAPGMKQEERRIGEVKTVPAKSASRTPKTEESPPAPPQYGEFVQVAQPRVQHTPAAAAASLPPPPALYQCSTWKGETYLGETATPTPQCAPLQVVGIDGSPALGMGQACEMKQDSCTEVPTEQLCDAWYRQLDEADFKRRYAADNDRKAREEAYALIETKLKRSRCATAAPAPP